MTIRHSDAPAPDAPASRKQVAVVSAGVGAVVGFVAGLFVASPANVANEGSDGRRDAPETAHSDEPVVTSSSPPSASAGASAGAAAGAPGTPPSSELHLDLGVPAPEGLISGKRAPHDVDGRPAYLVGADPLTVRATLTPPDPASWLVVVAHAAEGETTGSLAVTAGSAPLATWSVNRRWSLFATPLSGKIAGGDTTFSFSRGEGGSATAEPALAFVDLETSSDSVTLDLKKPSERARLLSGFSEPEGVDSPNPFVWSRGKASRLGFVLSPGEGEYELVLTAGSLPPIAPLDVAVRLNEKPLGKITVTAPPSTATLRIPRGLVVRGANELAFAYPKTAKPSVQNPASHDDRDLAVSVHALAVHPLPPAP